MCVYICEARVNYRLVSNATGGMYVRVNFVINSDSSISLKLPIRLGMLPRSSVWSNVCSLFVTTTMYTVFGIQCYTVYNVYCIYNIYCIRYTV